MENIMSLINTVGFPIFVAVWLLVKDQQEKKQTREALIKLTEAIDRLIERNRE
jgi:hypothetical protein